LFDTGASRCCFDNIIYNDIIQNKQGNVNVYFGNNQVQMVGLYKLYLGFKKKTKNKNKIKLIGEPVICMHVNQNILGMNIINKFDYVMKKGKITSLEFKHYKLK